MKKYFLIAIVAILVVGGVFYFSRRSSLPRQVSQFKSVEKKTAQELSLKEGKPNVPSYPKAVVDKDRCGKDAFYIEEKSADFVKNYCRFLRDNGWKLVHQDYPTCEDIKSFGGGYNYEREQDKISISVIKYGENATCFWIYKK